MPLDQTATTTAPAETSQSATLPDPAGDDTSVNWGEMADDILSDAEGTTIEGDAQVVDDGKAPEGFAQTPPAAKPTETTATPPVTAPTTETPAKTEQPVVQPVTEQPAKQPEVPFDEKAWEAEQLGKLEALYTLSEEGANEFLTEPEKTLPKLAAAIHMKVTKAVLASVQSIVPQIIAQQQTTTTVETKAKGMFYEANPDLNDPAYEAAILQVGGMYRQLNPKASAEDAVKKIGELVRVSMGLPPQGAVVPAAVPPAAPAAPRPFTPARGGAGAGVQPAQSANVWENLASEFGDS